MNIYGLVRDAILNDSGWPGEEIERPRWQRRMSWLVRKWRYPIWIPAESVRIVLVDSYDEEAKV